MNDIVIFESGDRSVGVRLEGETVWLTQRQMAEVFSTTPENVLMHLKNIFADNELEETATAKEILVVQAEGKRQVKRQLKHYNLDAIISVATGSIQSAGCSSASGPPACFVSTWWTATPSASSACRSAASSSSRR